MTRRILRFDEVVADRVAGEFDAVAKAEISQHVLAVAPNRLGADDQQLLVEGPGPASELASPSTGIRRVRSDSPTERAVSRSGASTRPAPTQASSEA